MRVAEAADPAAALQLTKVLADSQDPVLQGHVRYHLARLFLDGDDPERAVEILNEHFDKSINRTALDAEAAFFYAQALAEIPAPEHAIPRFRAFLQWFPDASERFRATAQQRIGELSSQLDSRLHVLADGMKKTTRDLRKPKTDKPVQMEQEGFVEVLNELIELYEEREKQGSGPPSGNGPSGAPANQSKLVEGEARIGSLEKHRTVADRWGDMKDKEREKIASDVNKTLPPQYRKMLEQYYRKLGAGEQQAGGR
jgi:tetratricopeptide (TPR) repeat protein